MDRLELKVPPLLVVLLVGAAMALASAALPALDYTVPGRRALAVALVLLGAAAASAGVLAFRRARTTVDPTRPETASALVAVGIYRVTRNPMYLGFLLALAGWAVWLSNVAACIGLPLFVLWMNRLQIAPEERALAQRFGAEFDAYRARVRRWL